MELKDILLASYPTAADRDDGVAFMNRYPDYFPSLLKLACAPQENRENIIASWILEKYLLPKISFISLYFQTFLEGMKQQTNESKKRSLVKVLYHYCRGEGRRKHFSYQQINSIVDICFSYMITSKKVAPISFAMKTLHFFRNHQTWIEDELQAFIQKKLPNSSPGFRAAVKQIS